MTNKTTDFQAIVASPGGNYLWSNVANWSNGEPTNGDTVDLLQTTSVDDIPDLALAALSSAVPGEPNANFVADVIVSANLYIAQGDLSDTNLTAQAGAGAGRVTVTIGMFMSRSDAVFTADGAGATLIDASPTELAETFVAQAGGAVEVAAAPAALSTFTYDDQPGSSRGVFAFEAPAGTNAAAINNLGVGDILELPGTSVGAVTFGTNSLSVTTSAGTYAFTNITYAGPTAGYTAAVDPVTGLVAITLNEVNSFQQSAKATSGPLSGDYLWSNAANWTDGVPANGASISVGAAGYDNLASLILGSLTLNAAANGVVHVTGESLTVASLTTSGSGGTAVLDADAADAGAPVTVTVRQAAAPGALLTATGAGATLLDQTSAALAVATDYAVARGGLVELFDTPLSTDIFSYTSNGTFAFRQPAATNLALFEGMGGGSTIEVPGSAVLDVTIGTNSVVITTDLGTYAFNSVVFAAPVVNYTASLDFGTLLQAVTFRGADTFTPTVQGNPGQQGLQQFLWSNAANWTEGVPVNGDGILTTYKSLSTEYQIGIDDLSALTLSSLNLALANYVEVEHSLTIGTLTVNGNILYAQSADPANPAVLTIGATAGALDGPEFNRIPGDPDGTEIRAIGAGATVIDRSANDPVGGFGAISGMQYQVSSGGKLEFLSAAPAATSKFLFLDPTGNGGGGQGTIAFGAPGAVVAAALQNVAPNDVLELPGTSVSNVVFGVNSLTVTTDAGTVAFTNVTYGNPVTGYTASRDAATGLVALAFTGPDTFQDVSIAAGAGDIPNYLWSDAANWNNGVPIDGDSVTVPMATVHAAIAIDDLPSLHLASLALGGEVLVGGGAAGDNQTTSVSLTVDTLVASAGGGLAVQTGAPGLATTVTVGTISGAGNVYDSSGLGSRLVIQSGTDQGNAYNGTEQGFLELPGAVADASTLAYEDSTIALKNPGAITNAAITDLRINYDDNFVPMPPDVLELPGSSVLSLVIGAHSLDIVTDAGRYRFTNVTGAGAGAPINDDGAFSITGYTAAPDPSTGLVAISFTGPDVFVDNVKATTGSLAGDYLWSSPADWSAGIPADGASVDIAPGRASVVYDDLATPLTLATLFLDQKGHIAVTDADLTVGTVSAVAGDSLLSDPLAGRSVTVTVGMITGAGGTYGANGGTFVDQSATDAGESYQAASGGLVQLAAAPSSTSTLSYAGTGSTFALSNPIAADSAAITGLAPGDLLELPGTTVLGASFGANSLSITTDAGTYGFTNVTYASPVGGYTAARDATTGLVAITFTGADLFEKNVAATSGPFAGKYLWSNAANWSAGVPTDGAAVVVADQTGSGYDDLPALTLASLNLFGSDLYVVGASLTIGTVTGGGHLSAGGTSYFGTLTADASDANAPVTVMVESIVDTSVYGDTYLASGVGATFIDQSGTDLGEKYRALKGGLFELAAAPNATSNLAYNATIVNTATQGASTIAVENPAATTTLALENVEPGDTLELPGTSVSAVTFGANSLSVTTDSGAYAFTNVSYGHPVTGYTAARDATTGLISVTFTGPDVFSASVKATSGPLAGDYLWSNAANWSQGVPVDGESVVAAVTGDSIDDLPILNLSTLTLSNLAQVFVAGGSLAVGYDSVTGGGGVLASFDALPPGNVTVGSFTTAGGKFGAFGAGSTAVAQFATDPGEFYFAADGGITELSAPPPDNSYLDYYSDFEPAGATGTFALRNPGATNAALLEEVVPGDVLELPGTSVSAATFGASSLSVTTNAGNYAFSNVSYSMPVTGYTAAPDPGTGLVAITFTGLDTFEANVKATIGSLAGDYLWSNPANWSAGVPINGDDVSLTLGAVSFDDLSALNLSSLTLNGGDVYVTGHSLTVATVAGGKVVPPNNPDVQFYYSTLWADAADAGGAVTVAVEAITGTGGDYLAKGAGADFMDQSATDPGDNYFAENGGVMQLSATPANTSELQYSLGQSTIELSDPAAASAAGTGFTPGNVLELPGTSVSNVSFGASSLSVTTSAGTYLFTNVGYAPSLPVTGYTATPDLGTGRVAITFTGPDVFSDNVKATSGSLAGNYLWSNPANWRQGAPPVDGDSVVSPMSGADDIAGLTLTALSQTATAVTEIIGDLTVGSVTNDGTLRVDNQAVLKITGSLTGNGVLTADPSTIELDGPVSAGQTLDLVGSGNTLVLGDPQQFEGTISGFTAGNVIDLENLSLGNIISKSFVDNILTLVESSGSIALAFANSPDPSTATFTFVPGVGTEITATEAPCFVAGTRIRTPRGDVPVEDLMVGEIVQTEFTGTAPIRWISQRDIDCRRHQRPERVWPVRVAAGAFGPDTPYHDLWLSPDHAVYVRGVLIPIKRLINGTSISQAPTDKVTYYHIELPRHDVLLAEGLRVESFLDMRDGSHYANRRGPVRLSVDFSARIWEAFGCAALVVTGPELAVARAQVERFTPVRVAA